MRRHRGARRRSRRAAGNSGRPRLGGAHRLEHFVVPSRKVRAVAGLSVPHAGRGPAPRIELFRNIYKDRFFYQLYFQQPGVAEAELETDVGASLRKIYYAASGEAQGRQAPGPAKQADAKYLEGLADPYPLPDWLTPDDLDYYAGNSQRSGFRGPLNRYRTSELDFAQQAEIANRRIEQPTAFIAGSLDPVLGFLPGSIWSRACANA